VKIDKLDKEIMAFLYEDGRATLTSLGSKLGPALNNDKEGISHVAVQKRLQKLIENEIIKVQANLNVVQLGYISAIVMIETKEYDAQKRIIERFRLCPRVVFMDLVSGNYNIILRAMAPSLKEMECFLNYCWLKQEEGIRNLEIYISTTNVKPRYSYAGYIY
jgi:DNA-binding Lrp family transcriptional regulator